MKIQQLSAHEAIASVHSAPQGLSSAEAERRLRELGPNLVPEVAHATTDAEAASGSAGGVI
jgi:cation transport ATPase-like protein